MHGLAEIFRELVARGLLTTDDPMMAASHFNWLVMAQPLNEVMLLGDTAIPPPTELKRYATEGVRAFLAAYRT
jgi:TetR/AcrR family transcriptional repressor of mexJK operon